MNSELYPFRHLQALSIQQPWAHRILYEGKDVENRRWNTRFRGLVLIHASKGFDGDMNERRAFIANEGRGINQGLFGGIVGVMEITDCVTEMESKWFCGPFGFVIRNARPLPFTPCKGALGFFRPKLEELAA